MTDRDYFVALGLVCAQQRECLARTHRGAIGLFKAVPAFWELVVSYETGDAHAHVSGLGFPFRPLVTEP